ncbi:MAG: hypothetical protein AMJ41_03900 [candidate division Zixibacteria bacterium DG_27]|nr:MAG: hypothetical protein AMJ41_03900 [candidate division Zixibacteria bacterium DG_27]
MLLPLFLPPSVFGEDNEIDTAVAEALKCIKMTPRDLSFRNDYLEVDPFRLEVVDHLMKNPLKMIPYSRELSLSLWESSDAASLLRIAAREISIVDTTQGEIVDIISQCQSGCDPEEVTAILFRQQPKDRFWKRRHKEFVRDLKGLPPKLREGLVTFLDGINLLHLASGLTFEALSQVEYDSLRYGMALLLSEDEFNEFKTVEELDSLEKLGEKWAENIIHLALKIEISSAFSCAFAGIEKIEEGIEQFRKLPPEEFEKAKKKDGFLFRSLTPLGLVVIGDHAPQSYSGEILFGLDMGGDDCYSLRFKRDRNVTIIIDLSGNDIYRVDKDSNYVYTGYSRELIPKPVGICGYEFIYDEEGDDIYRSSNFSLGAGLLGIGLLWDRKGNDAYFGDTFCIGAGCFGVGILRDDQGDDHYNGALFSQGFGFVGGFGALVDSDGHDTYFTGNKYKDVLRYHDHYLTLSQGFAYGIRPLISGGAGLLADFAGNDTYISDIFGQGSSYWWGFGGLVDLSGNDRYLSFQYAQGAGTHMTVGILLDENGDDIYYSKGVSQGCGHDLATGLLCDLSGNDNYSAYDLSQAAGSANGLGMLLDLKGNDGYYVKSPRNTQGYGNPRRDYGSIGIFLDLEGEDHYEGGKGKDGSYWNYSKWGIGIDK